MSEVANDLKYTESHEWIRLEGEEAVLGITDHAQAMLGDLVFVELPELGVTLEAGDECAVVESVKAAADVYSPLAGEVVAVNEDLVDSPEVINDDPYNQGWMYRIRLDDVADVQNLMTPEDYAAHIQDEES